MPRSTMIFPIVLLCIGVDLLSFIGSLSNEICHFPRFFRGQRHQLAAYLFALEIISHIMAQCSKSRKASRSCITSCGVVPCTMFQ